MDLIPSPAHRLAADLARLVAILDEAGRWLHADEIRRLEPRLCARRVRQLAEAAEGEIISCTSRGYRLTRHATPDEVRHSLADLRSRAKKLLSRYAATSRAWHSSAHHQPRP